MPKDKKKGKKKSRPSIIKTKFRRVAPQPTFPLKPTKTMPMMPKPTSDSVRVPTFEATSMVEKTVREPEDKPITKIIGKIKVRLPKKKKDTE